MAFDSDLRTLLKSIAKVSRKPFQNIGVQAQKKCWDEGSPEEPPLAKPQVEAPGNKIAR